MIDYIKSLYVLGESESDNEIKKEYRLKANQLARQCLDDYSNSDLAHKWYVTIIQISKNFTFI